MSCSADELVYVEWVRGNLGQMECGAKDAYVWSKGWEKLWSNNLQTGLIRECTKKSSLLLLTDYQNGRKIFC